MKEKYYICEANSDNISKLNSIGIFNGCALTNSDKTIIIINNEFLFSSNKLNEFDNMKYQIIQSKDILSLRIK